MGDRKRVAVFGGAFDPPTANHMIGVAEVVHSGLADEVLLVPCGPRPDKPNLSSPVDRYVMCQLAVNTAFSPDMPIRVSDIEVLLPEAMATYDTLSALRAAQPDSDFTFVIGTDWLQPGTDLRTWTSKDPDKFGGLIVTGEKLLAEFDFLVIQRPGYIVDDLSAFGPRMSWLVMPEGVSTLEGNLSSTEIRKRTAACFEAEKGTQFIEGLVTPAVLSFIGFRKLYQKSPGDEERNIYIQIARSFKENDRSQDETLSAESFKQVFGNLGAAGLSDEELQALVRAAGADANAGRIRYMKFLTFIMAGTGLTLPDEPDWNAPVDSGVQIVTNGARRNVAIFGGSFDPPTLSHIMGLAEIVNSGLCDEAVMVPCGPRPDKPALQPPLTRYCMCQLAVHSSYSSSMPVRVSDLEVFEPEAMATYDALKKLQAQDPEANFVFVIGSDWLQEGTDIRQWTSKDPVTGQQIVTGHKLVAEFDFLVIKRPGYEVKDVTAFGPRMKWMEMQKDMKFVEANLSSSEVRKRAVLDYRTNDKLQLIDGVVPPAVYNFVKREGIYRPQVVVASLSARAKAQAPS